VTSVPAVQSPSYNVITQTLIDSSSGGPHHTTFLVSAHTDDPNVFYLSPLDSGYSVDNIPPAGITGASLTPETDGTMSLKWNADRVDQDLQGYHIYRSASSGFSVGPQTLIGSTTDTLYADTTAPGGATAYYRIAGVDMHDNVGVPSGELSGTPVGVADGKEIPTVFSLSQNYPNPFNPKTRIRFGCPQRSHVLLSLFNLLGQEVAKLVEGDFDAGYHSVELDGSPLATGVYIYRIQAGSFTAVKKLLFVK